MLPGAGSKRDERGGGACDAEALAIPVATQLGRLFGPRGVAGDHVSIERCGLLPEFVERCFKFLFNLGVTRRLADQIPLDTRHKRRPRQVARPDNDDPARRIGNPPGFWMKRRGRSGLVVSESRAEAAGPTR